MPPRVDETLIAGESKQLNIAFVATEAINNATLRVVPNLEKYVVVHPSNVSTISVGSVIKVTLTFQTDNTELPEILDGTIQLRSGNKSVSTPLPISLKVVWTKYANDDDRYQLEYPPVLQPTELFVNRPEFLRGILLQNQFEMTNLAIGVYQNNLSLPVDEWYFSTLADNEYSFPDTENRSHKPVMLNGIPGLEVNSTILGYKKKRIFIPRGANIIGLESSVPEDAEFPPSYFEILNTFSFF